MCTVNLTECCHFASTQMIKEERVQLCPKQVNPASKIVGHFKTLKQAEMQHLNGSSTSKTGWPPTLPPLKFFFVQGGLHKLCQQARGEGGLAKGLWYYISLCSKLADRGGRGVKNRQNLADIVYGRPLITQLLVRNIEFKIHATFGWTVAHTNTFLLQNEKVDFR